MGKKEPRNIKVFLGSSSDFNYQNKNNTDRQKELKVIVETLHQSYPGVIIKPWWEFGGTDKYLFEHVKDNILDCDFCIFILAKDLELRKKINKRKHIPNSNVLIEIGLALSKGKRVILLNWDMNEVLTPSDLQGKFQITTGLTDDKDENLSYIVESFGNILKNYLNDRPRNTVIKMYNNINIYYDIDLARELSRPNIPTDWGTKALFIGSKSASLWSIIEGNEQLYTEASVIKNFLGKDGLRWDPDSKIQSIDEVVVDNIVSFGPGSGRIDNEILHFFKRGDFKPFYIPIDINITLLSKAITLIDTSANYPVPFAVLDDFEDGSCFSQLKRLILSKEHEIHKRNLFSIVGVTFSNYSKDESFFLDGVSEIMQPGDDYLLLDVIAEKKSGTAFVKTVDDQIHGIYKEFIVHSIRKRFPKIPRNTKEAKLIDGVNVSLIPNSLRSSLTIVPKTQIVQCTYTSSEEETQTLLIAKKYDYLSLKSFLSERFTIEASSYDASNRRGIFLLSKPEKPEYDKSK